MIHVCRTVCPANSEGLWFHDDSMKPESLTRIRSYHSLHSGVHLHCPVDGIDANKRVVTHTMSDDPLILVWLLLFPVGETT